ncbi:MAG TPA: VWA domain-containing protein, partial [Thermoanaerobaculia bacterium]|nr:VWA domain-containing protein [Thermoanaerobaculia bacterium]
MKLLVAAVFLIALAVPAAAQDIRSQMEITVERILLDLYVTDDRGEPVTGLGKENFRVRVDGVEAEIDGVEFVDMTALPDLDNPIDPDTGDILYTSPGRLLIFFFQTDPQRESTRVTGQMKMLRQAKDFLETLTPQDRVAVVQFDSHLKVREDFTNDHEVLERAIDETMKMDKPPRPRKVHSPSLLTRLDLDEAREAASSEKALFLIGNALIPIPGPKSLVMFGWGLGRFGSSGVRMTPDYFPAKRALERARTSVFALDVTVADYHSLEVGMKKAAEDTGGFYAKTHIFPQFAMDKLERTISGRYELFVKRPPDLPRGLHRIVVDVVGKRNVSVLVREMWEDGPVAG